MYRWKKFQQVTQHDKTITQLLEYWYYPGDFITKLKQVNNQSDLISMSSFAGPSYLTIRSSVRIILLWDPCICNIYNLCQTRSNYTVQKPHQCALYFTEERTSFCYSLLSGQFQLKLFYCGKGRQNITSNVPLYPCECSLQNCLDRSTTVNYLFVAALE